MSEELPERRDLDLRMWGRAIGDNVYIAMNFLYDPQRSQPRPLQQQVPQSIEQQTPSNQKHPQSPSLLHHNQSWPHQPRLGTRQDQAIATRSPPRSSKGRSRIRRCCCVFLETLFLLPLMLCMSGCVLLPSAAYFIPRDLLINAFSENADAPILININPPLADIGDPLQNCSWDYFDATRNSCVSSCEGFRLDDGVDGISVYRIIVMVAGGIACATTLGFMILALTVWRKTM